MRELVDILRYYPIDHAHEIIDKLRAGENVASAVDHARQALIEAFEAKDAPVRQRDGMAQRDGETVTGPPLPRRNREAGAAEHVVENGPRRNNKGKAPSTSAVSEAFDRGNVDGG
ncbi:hypothetical protein CAC42_4566 [Sphaceloma murrayae]|uniref:Uncharacterized protein n=1 Tax=Sphaceloma murrayae TaxID=2082308 RepID=A0A2K1QNN0_9PEZI|nr:hypothetical protein CAC42_4566 [Sphaceloma murrayae]